MLVRSRSPVRICDIGGWTDTRFAERGAVLNLAISLYSHCLVEKADDGEQCAANDHGAVLRALDLNLDVSIEDVRRIEYDGALDLLKAAVKRLGIPGGFRASVWSDAPPGSGVGSSAAVGVSLIAALGQFAGQKLPPHVIARMAQELETVELGLECGVQDQYAAAFGGVCFMEIEYPRVQLSRLPISPNFLWELEERLVLVYVGESRLSDAVHRLVIERYASGVPEAVEAMEMLRQAAYAMKDAMLGGDFSGVEEAINVNWAAQKRLHPDITNPTIEETFAVAMKAGAVAGKANGAGGGGTITFLAQPGCEMKLHQALAELPHCSVLPCRLSDEGVRSWVVK
ncbi:MAG: GHMP family kinase ATP-binding protein [Candidatus Zipacnadales bacterium]